MERRDFLKNVAAISAVSTFILQDSVFSNTPQFPDIAVIKDGEPLQLVQEALQKLGGMSRFVSKGDIVVVKANISWDRIPEQAATTNPEVVAEVIRQCFHAGAKKVKVFDHTLNVPSRCYTRSGIEAAAKAAGADVQHIYEPKFKKVSFPEGELIKSWEIYKDVLEADRIINIPIAKHHSVSEAQVSLGMKNLMGFLGGVRGKFHRTFDVKITDLSTRIKPDLIILDAYRMLLRNGPTGGNLADVALKKTIIAGTDPVAVDSYGATLFNLEPSRLPFLQRAHERGLGEIDYHKLTVETVSLAL
jgi:uncharacterized protein (DUF362 family)